MPPSCRPQYAYATDPTPSPSIVRSLSPAAGLSYEELPPHHSPTSSRPRSAANRLTGSSAGRLTGSWSVAGLRPAPTHSARSGSPLHGSRSGSPPPLDVGPGLAVSAEKLASMQVANEELRARNTALLQKANQQEVELWRIKSAARALGPTERVAAVPRAEEAALADEEAEAVTGTLWHFLDIAVQGAARARALSRKSHAETLIALEAAFNPLRMDERLKARALVSQTARTSAKMQAACQQLESEAAAAKAAHDADAAAWAQRLRLLGTRMDAQQEAVATSLLLELEREEGQHHAAGGHARRTIERLEAEARSLRAASDEERRKLAAATAELRRRDAVEAANAERLKSETALENARLQQQVMRLGSELEQAQGQREEDKRVGDGLAAELQSKLAAIREQLGGAMIELEQARTEGRAALLRAEKERASAIEALRHELGLLHAVKNEEGDFLRGSVERLRAEKHATVTAAVHQVRAVQADREADANHLHAKITRLQRLHKEALAAGTTRGRQLLYAEALKSPDVLRHSTLTWRGEDWGPGLSATSPPRQRRDTLLYDDEPLRELHEQHAEALHASPLWRPEGSPYADRRAQLESP